MAHPDTPSAGIPILILDHETPDLLQRLRDIGCNITCRGPNEDVREAIQVCRPEIIIVRTSLVQNAQLQGAGFNRLKLVMRAGTGTDNIDVELLENRGVVVANAAGANAVAVAELTLAHLLNADRRLSDQVDQLRQGKWERRSEFAACGRGLYGRTLAVLGAGAIGQEVMKRAVAFGMKVRCWSRSLTPKIAAELGVARSASAEEAVDGADALSVHLPLADDTRSFVGEALLRRLRHGAIVVNTSRGGVVDDSALVRLTSEMGLIAGVDVYEREPSLRSSRFEDEEISGCKRIYGTLHTGAWTSQGQICVQDAVVEVVGAYLNGLPVPRVVTSTRPTKCPRTNAEHNCEIRFGTK